METITLRNGVKMPILGYGVYQVDPKENNGKIWVSDHVMGTVCRRSQRFLHQPGS